MEQRVRLVAAYGNPGRKYALLASNIGFLIVEAIGSKIFSTNPNSTSSQWVLRSRYMMLPVNFDPMTILVKPRTFENKFDDTVLSLYSFYKVKPEDLYIIYPDQSLPFGQVKIDRELGQAPEAVIKIDKKIKPEEYWKIRVGVGGLGEELGETELAVVKYLGEKIALELKILDQ